MFLQYFMFKLSISISMLVVLILAIALNTNVILSETVEDKIRNDPDLSQFYSLLERNTIANFTLQYRQVTVFSPTNQAFQKFQGKLDDSIVLYHITNLAQSLEELTSPLTSELEGNPPIWVTKKNFLFSDEIFVNNALISKSRSNFVSQKNGKKQVLHIIDEVLTPIVSIETAPKPIYNPNAYQFLNQSESLEISPHRIRLFRETILKNNKEEIFNSEGRHTFFIPVDDGFKIHNRQDMIDTKVIDGHVIPNHVLFVNPTTKNVPFETLAFGDNLKVTISFLPSESKKEDEQLSQTFIKSKTHFGDTLHPTGVVLSEIVKANIPVKNGVVHLIQKPLIIVDTTIKQFVEEKDNGPLFRFYGILQDTEAGQEMLRLIDDTNDITLFAPENDAWNAENLKPILRNETRLKELLNMHIVFERLPVEKILKNNEKHIFQIKTNTPRQNLYFNLLSYGSNNSNHTLTIEGGGVNATVIQSDIAATNGIIHIIDRVLGVAQTNVLNKLRTDPMLNLTYALGQYENFNNQLDDSSRRYTYFVPRDKAWNDFALRYPSTYKKMFMKDYSYYAKQILERHLVISDYMYTVERMKAMANGSNNFIVLPTIRDRLKIRIKESSGNVFMEWNGEWIQVFRPNVECTNGVIHVIDKPFLNDNDMYVRAVAAATAKPMSVVLLHAFSCIFTFFCVFFESVPFFDGLI